MFSWEQGAWNNGFDSWIDQGWTNGFDRWVDHGWNNGFDTWVDQGWSNGFDTWVDQGWNNGFDTWTQGNAWEDDSSSYKWEDNYWFDLFASDSSWYDASWSNNDVWAQDSWADTPQPYVPSVKKAPVDPIHSFWFVASVIVLLLLPLVALGLGVSYPEITPKDGETIFTIYCGLAFMPLLGFGLGIFIPKMVKHRNFIRKNGRSKSPLSSFSFVLSFILIFLSVLYGVLFPLFITNNPTAVEELYVVYDKIWLYAGIGGSYWFVIGLVLLISKIASHVTYSRSIKVTTEETTETEEVLTDEYVIVEAGENYLKDLGYLSVANSNSRIMMQQISSGNTFDFGFVDAFEYENNYYIVASIKIDDTKSNFYFFKIIEPENKIYLLPAGDLRKTIAIRTLDRVRERNKKLQEEINNIK